MAHRDPHRQGRIRRARRARHPVVSFSHREVTLDKLFVLLQSALPARALGRIVHRISRSRRPWLKNALIRAFIRLYGIDTTELDRRAPDDYPTLNAFFTRPLRAGARPVDPDPASIVSPADGTLELFGRSGDQSHVPAKGFRFRLPDLLGAGNGEAADYAQGKLAVIYLAPANYHRVHMPVDGRITSMLCIPGRRWAVNRRTAGQVPGLFAANERVVCHCATAAGPLAIVLVGAMNVASISLAWAGEVLPRPGTGISRWAYPAGDMRLTLRKGDLLGQFNLGSTVILVAAPGVLDWDGGLAPGQPLRMGQRLGQLRGGAVGP